MGSGTKRNIKSALVAVGSVIVAAALFLFLNGGDKDAIWRLFGFEPLITKHICQIKSPQGISNFSEYWDGHNRVVHFEVERLCDHQKTSGNMFADDYKKLWDRVKADVVPGTEKEIILNP